MSNQLHLTLGLVVEVEVVVTLEHFVQVLLVELMDTLVELDQIVVLTNAEVVAVVLLVLVFKEITLLQDQMLVMEDQHSQAQSQDHLF